MKLIQLPCFGIVVTINKDKNGVGGSITSELSENVKSYEDQLYDAAIDGIESLILAHACAEIDIETPQYIEGIKTAVEAISNNF